MVARHSLTCLALLTALLPGCYVGVGATSSGGGTGTDSGVVTATSTAGADETATGGETEGQGGAAVNPHLYGEIAFPGLSGIPVVGVFETPTGLVEITYTLLENGYGVFDGDMILSGPDDPEERSANGGGNAPDALWTKDQQNGLSLNWVARQWPNRRIPYQYSSANPPTAAHQQLIRQAMTYIENRVDVLFVEHDPIDSGFDRVRIYEIPDSPEPDPDAKSLGGCSSQVGRVGGVQKLFLSPSCYDVDDSEVEGIGIAVHELSHAIGLFHEQNRDDRVTVIAHKPSNSLSGLEENFLPIAGDKSPSGYNINSIMQYPSCAFSACKDSATGEICKTAEGNECPWYFWYHSKCDDCNCDLAVPNADGSLGHICRYPTLTLSDDDSYFEAQRTSLQSSDIESLELALACPGNHNGLYCGGPVGLSPEILYMCENGYYTESETCSGTCIVEAPGDNDHCVSTEVCPSGDNGWYCGRTVGLVAHALYWCSGGDFFETMPAPINCRALDPPQDCIVAPAGHNDYCSMQSSPDDPIPPPGSDCVSGACCEGDSFSPAGTVCANDADSQYGCPWGMGAGDDVGVQYRDRTCSGTSSACDGPYANWEAWQTQDACSAAEFCADGDPTCNPGCAAASYWAPDSTSDVEWDVFGVQSLDLQKEEISGDQIRVRLCKVGGGNFVNDIHLDYEEWAKYNGLYMHAGTVLSAGQACSNWAYLDTSNWLEGENIGAEVRVVSPAMCEALWDDQCSVDPGCGNCWFWLSDTVMQRTCL